MNPDEDNELNDDILNEILAEYKLQLIDETSVDSDGNLDDSVTVEPPKPAKGKVTLSNNTVVSREQERMARMAQVTSKFATTLTLKPIAVNLNDKGPSNNAAVSWSFNDRINFNKQLIGDLTDPEIVTSLKGHSLHEIGHIMLTPPLAGTKLGKAIETQSLDRAFSALEDQRVETQLSSMFSNVGDWLTAATIRDISVGTQMNPDQEQYQYAFLAGRKYLPAKLRGVFRSKFADQSLINQVDAIVDEYVGLDLSNPKTHATAIKLISEFNQLIGTMHTQSQSQPEPGGDEGNPMQSDYPWIADCNWPGRTPTSFHPTKKNDGGKAPISNEQRKELADKVKEDIKQGNYPLPEEPDEPVDEPVDGCGPAGDGDGDDDSEEKSDQPGGKLAGNSGDVQDVMDNELKSILKRKHKEIIKTIAQYNGEIGLDGRSVPPPPRSSRRADKPVAIETLKASRAFTRELELLRADYDPGWKHRTDTGRLDVKRYMGDVELDEVFDEWTHGREDVVDIECVVAIDNSGSMGGVMTNAYQSLWAIKRALDKIGASTTVVVFSTDGHERLLYSANERAEATYRDIGVGGGTEPAKAIRYSRSILANSKRAIKLFIAITDGEWYGTNGNESDEMIRQFRQANVITALAMIGARYDDRQDVTINTHGCEVAVAVDDMSQLFVLAKDMTRLGIKRNLVKN